MQTAAARRTLARIRRDIRDQYNLDSVAMLSQRFDSGWAQNKGGPGFFRHLIYAHPTHRGREIHATIRPDGSGRAYTCRAR